MTVSATLKKRNQGNIKKIDVNQIWDFNGSLECNLMQHVREKLITFSAGNIRIHYQE